MELEFHQLEMRHADLRIRDPKREGRLLAALATQGQQVPVVVVAAEVEVSPQVAEVAEVAPVVEAARVPQPARVPRYILIDGYLRVSVLQKLGHDTVLATEWPVSELDALVHHHHLSVSSRSVFEQAWFLSRLREQGLSLDELAKRLCRSKSWVSRRLALVNELAEPVQGKVRQGVLPPHAAMKYLVPLARANKKHCEALVDALGRERVSDREMATLYAGWRHADALGKERLCQSPRLYLRAQQAQAADKKTETNPGSKLINELGILGAVAWRAKKQLHEGLDFETNYKRTELDTAWRSAEHAFNDLARKLTEVLAHVGSRDTDSHPEAT